MKKGNTVALECYECGKRTKHIVINCRDNAVERVFLGVVTFGLAEAIPHVYDCECSKCGSIRSARL